MYNLFLYSLWSDAPKPLHTEPFKYFPESPHFLFAQYSAFSQVLTHSELQGM